MAAYRWVYDSRHLPITGISFGTQCSVIEYGLPLLFYSHKMAIVSRDHLDVLCDVSSPFVGLCDTQSKSVSAGGVTLTVFMTGRDVGLTDACVRDCWLTSPQTRNHVA